MDIVRIRDVGEDELISSDVVELLDEWDSGTTYIVDDEVKVTDIGYQTEYVCMVGHTNKYPPDNIYDADTSTGYWSLKGKTNTYRMFDKTTKSVSSNASGEINVSFKLGSVVDSIVVVNTNSDEITVTGTDVVDGIVFDETKQLVNNDNIIDPYAWFFEDKLSISDCVFTGIPNYANLTFDINFDNNGSAIHVGEVAPGKTSNVGVTGYGTIISGEDFSDKSVDDDTGYITLTKNEFQKEVRYSFICDTDTVNYIQQLLYDVRAEPHAYIGEIESQETIIIGWHTDWAITLTANKSLGYIQVEEFVN